MRLLVPTMAQRLFVFYRTFKIDLSNDNKSVLLDSWAGCKDADVLLESPSAMAGVHIAEALSMPSL